MPSASQITHRLDRIFLEPERPGAQYVVTDANGVIYEYSGGWGNIAQHDPVRLSTVMMLHSLTKVITAVSVLQLAEQRTLGLDDPADRYLDGLPYWPDVTIRRLLAQTSGLPHPMPLKWIHVPEESDGYDDDAALRKVMAEFPELTFPPGEKCGYSNISYWILGRIIETLSGLTYAEYIRREICERLDPPAREILFRVPEAADLASGYIAAGTPFELQKDTLLDPRIIGDYAGYFLKIKPYYCNGNGCCRLFGTARAVSALLRDLLGRESRILNPSARALLFQQQQVNNGELIPMTLGWHIANIDGESYYFKEGCGAGFHCEMRIYRERGIASVVLANEMSFNVKAFLNRYDPLIR